METGRYSKGRDLTSSYENTKITTVNKKMLEPTKKIF